MDGGGKRERGVRIDGNSGDKARKGGKGDVVGELGGQRVWEALGEARMEGGREGEADSPGASGIVILGHGTTRSASSRAC